MNRRSIAVILLSALASACASTSGDETPPLEVASAKSAEALRDCILSAAPANLPAGALPPKSAESSRAGGYLITFPPLAHTGIVVSRGAGAGSSASWHSLDPERFGKIPDVIRGCAAT